MSVIDRSLIEWHYCNAAWAFKTEEIVFLLKGSMSMLKNKIFLLICSTALLVSCGGPDSTTPQHQGQSDQVSGQIVNGIVSKKGTRPYMAFMKKNGRFMCSASVISKEWILTAAHCLNRNARPSSYSFRVGMYNVHSDEGETIQVSELHLHPGWTGRYAGGNDIALAKLAKPISHPDVKPVLLPGNAVEAVLDVKGKFAVVSGWGATVSSGKSRAQAAEQNILGSRQLREVALPIVPNVRRCDALTIPANYICTPKYENKSPCYGDSGGPLAQEYKGKWYQLGVVSHGTNDCTGSGYFARVNYFLPWIKEVSGLEGDNGDGGGDDGGDQPKLLKGSVRANSSSFQPKTKGFKHQGGMLKAKLSSNVRGDFDFYLQKKEGMRWVDVSSSTNEGHNETIQYNGAAGLYRWEIYAYEGSGEYSVELLK